jgi:UDP-hydrolysing UDP-N-acetyl-D-glucosamine 2-epimerase
MQALRSDPAFQLQVVVSGTHLAPEYGLTWKVIVEDGFEIDEQIDMLVSGDSPTAATKSLGMMVLGMADALRRLQPDFIVMLGDRYEMLGVVAAAALFNIPVVHLHGGEITKGAIDDAFRHAITKLSHLHFTSTEDYRRRVIQLGEPPSSVFNVGAIGLDNIQQLSLLSRDELAESLAVDLTMPYFLTTYHPVTAIESDAVLEVDMLIEAMLSFDGIQIIITRSNADVGGRAINQRLDYWAAKVPSRLHVYASLGQLRYLSAILHSIGVVGNSSSGILEAPSLGVGTLNIGTRQEGRSQAQSIINCQATVEAIRQGLAVLLSAEFQQELVSVINPYGDGHTTERIMKILRQTEFTRISHKDFYDFPASTAI